LPGKGWAVVDIREKIRRRIRKIVVIQNKKRSEWERPITLSAFVERALINEIQRVENGGQLRKSKQLRCSAGKKGLPFPASEK